MTFQLPFRSQRTCYPLNVTDERRFDQGYDGPVFVWDIDKTYLSTHFSSPKGMMRIPIEFAVDKKAIAGMPQILRGLRQGPGPAYEGLPLYFVSASPPQLKSVITKKMLLDGVEYDGIIFKDWIRSLAQLRPGRLQEQVGFKLCALITARQPRPRSVEYLFGDDVEQDALAFYLYARILTGEMPPGRAEIAMKEAGVPRDDRHCVRTLLDRLDRPLGSVERIYIHLETKTPPEQFAKFGSLVRPVKGSYQLALALYADHLLPADTVTSIADAMEPSHRTAMETDAVARGLIPNESDIPHSDRI